MTDQAHSALPTDAEHFRQRFETIDGLRLHYVMAGVEEAEPLVLLAGHPESRFA